MIKRKAYHAHTDTHLNGRCELMSSKLEIEGVIVIRHLLKEEELNPRKKSLKIFFNFDLLAEKKLFFRHFHASTQARCRPLPATKAPLLALTC